MRRARRLSFAVPLMMTKNWLPVSPSDTSTFPAGTTTSSARLATSASSRRESAEKSGTWERWSMN